MSLLRIELLESCNPVSGKSYNALLNQDVFTMSTDCPICPRGS